MSRPAILAQLGDGGPSSTARGFSDVPTLNPVHIVILPTGGTESEKRAQDAYNNLVDELDSVSESNLPSSPIAPFSDKSVFTALVGVSDDGGWQQNSVPFQAALQGLNSDDPTCVVLPVVKNSTPVEAAFPEHPVNVGAINFEFWIDDIAEVTPSILAAARIVPMDFQVFISYRRQDTQEMAQQLFVELEKSGFQVFLDRYAIPPGVDFQEYLVEQLDRMSMVVFLESAEFNSEWTKKEAAFAQRRKMGLCALTVPGHKNLIGAVPEENRLRLQESQVIRDPHKFGGVWLKEKAVRPVVDRIKQEHNRAYLRRKRSLEIDVTGALDKNQLGHEVVKQGVIKVSGSGSDRKIWLNPRGPGLVDYHSVCSTDPEGVTSFVVAPSLGIASMTRRQLVWLGGKCAAELWDPEDVVEMAARIKAGGP